MSTFEKFSLVALRLALGFLMLYAGVTKLADPAWSAGGYLAGAKTFHGLYAFFASPAVLPAINVINEWGLTLLGVSLLLGIGVRLSGILGALLMLLYYFPVLDFPVVAPHSYLVDEHIVYAAALLLLSAVRAGRVFGLEHWCTGLPVCRRFPRLPALVG